MGYDIVGARVVEDVLLDLTGQTVYQQVGSELRYECPFCHKEKNKFYINSDTGAWICYNCDRHGNLPKLVAEYLDLSYSDAYDYLSDFGYTSIGTKSDNRPDYVSTDENMGQTFYEQLISIPEAVDDTKISKDRPTKCHNYPTNTHMLINDLNNQRAFPYFDYLHKRGIELYQIKDEGISYVVEGTFVKEDGSSQSISHSIVFTTWNALGQPLYWSTRSIESNPYVKSINSPALPGEYSRRDVVWNIQRVNESTKSVVLVEGIFNGLTVNQVPGYIAIATLGKNVTDEQLEVIKGHLLGDTRLILYLDDDAKDTMLKLADRFNKAGIPENKLFLVNNPDKYRGLDANALGKERTADVLANCLVKYNYVTRLEMLDGR